MRSSSASSGHRPGAARRRARETPYGLLSRGSRHARLTFVVNLPGSPGGSRDGSPCCPALEHALQLLAARRPSTTDVSAGAPCPRASRGSSRSSTRCLRCRSPTSARFSPSAACRGHDMLWITLAMVGARSLAMAPNRLIDAGIDARNPRTATRELPGARCRHAGRSSSARLAALFLVAVWQLAPLTHGCGRSPCRLRRLPVPEALDVALPPLARRGRRARADRRLGGDDGPAAVAGWLLGGAVALWVAGFDSSTRSSTSRSTARRACTRSRRASARAARSRVRGSRTSPPSRASSARASASRRRALLVGVAAVALLLGYEHSLVRPGDLRRLDAAFFTMNGVISVVFACS